MLKLQKNNEKQFLAQFNIVVKVFTLSLIGTIQERNPREYQGMPVTELTVSI